MEEYKSSLFNHETIHKKKYTIQSTKHELYTNKINKIALSGDDDKRIILQDRIHTLAIGHYKSWEKFHAPCPKCSETYPCNVLF